MARSPRCTAIGATTSSFYHGRDHGELYDLQEDPDEFDYRWENPAFANIRADLIKRSFDTSVIAMDRGPRRIGGI